MHKRAQIHTDNGKGKLAMKNNIKRTITWMLVLLSIFASAMPASAAKYITASKAKKIALNHAGRKSSAVRFVKVRRERDDGRMIYDVEFRLRKNRRMEYEYEIDARTGRIIEWDFEYDD